LIRQQPSGDPHLKKHILKLEIVHKHGTKMLLELRDLRIRETENTTNINTRKPERERRAT